MEAGGSHDSSFGVVHAWLGQNVTEARYGHSKAASAPLILSGAGICYTKVYITFRATSAVVRRNSDLRTRYARIR